MISLTEFDKEEQRILDWQEGFEEGYQEGYQEGLEKARNMQLRSIIIALKKYTPNFETLYANIINTPYFANCSKEDARRIYDEDIAQNGDSSLRLS